MSRPTPSASRIEATRILLLLQASVLLLSLLAFFPWMDGKVPPPGTPDPTNAAVTVVTGTVVAAAAILAIAARQVRRRRVVGWVLALLAQLCVASLPAYAVYLGAVYGVGAGVLVVLALGMTVWLLRTDVLRTFLRRTARRR